MIRNNLKTSKITHWYVLKTIKPIVIDDSSNILQIIEYNNRNSKTNVQTYLWMMSLLSCRHTLTDDVPQTFLLQLCFLPLYIWCFSNIVSMSATDSDIEISEMVTDIETTYCFDIFLRCFQHQTTDIKYNASDECRQAFLRSWNFSDTSYFDCSPSCDCSLYRKSGEFGCKHCSQNEYNTWVCPVIICYECFTNYQK